VLGVHADGGVDIPGLTALRLKLLEDLGQRRRIPWGGLTELLDNERGAGPAGPGDEHPVFVAIDEEAFGFLGEKHDDRYAPLFGTASPKVRAVCFRKVRIGCFRWFPGARRISAQGAGASRFGVLPLPKPPIYTNLTALAKYLQTNLTEPKKSLCQKNEKPAAVRRRVEKGTRFLRRNIGWKVSSLLPCALLMAVRLQALPALVLVHLETSLLLQIAHGVKGERARKCPADGLV